MDIQAKRSALPSGGSPAIPWPIYSAGSAGDLKSAKAQRFGAQRAIGREVDGAALRFARVPQSCLDKGLQGEL
jgi:hypothetical protein